MQESRQHLQKHNRKWLKKEGARTPTAKDTDLWAQGSIKEKKHAQEHTLTTSMSTKAIITNIPDIYAYPVCFLTIKGRQPLSLKKSCSIDLDLQIVGAGSVAN